MELHKLYLEDAMHRQKTLPLDGRDALDALWQRFPEASRREVVAIYARLMAAAVRGENKKEDNDDKPKH
jgi:hypothetical protein